MRASVPDAPTPQDRTEPTFCSSEGRPSIVFECSGRRSSTLAAKLAGLVANSPDVPADTNGRKFSV
jgi:hypothetical protein